MSRAVRYRVRCSAPTDQSLHLHISQWRSLEAAVQKSSQRSVLESSGTNESHGTPTRQKEHALHAHHEQCVRWYLTSHHVEQTSRDVSSAWADVHEQKSQRAHLHRPQCWARYVALQKSWQSRADTSSVPAAVHWIGSVALGVALAKLRALDVLVAEEPPAAAAATTALLLPPPLPAAEQKLHARHLQCAQ